MTKPGAKLPYEDSRIAKLLTNRINELAGLKTQREIAADIGYEKPNVLSMYKRGEAKIPLDRIPDFARALSVDAALLFRYGLEQWWPNQGTAIAKLFSDRIITQNEKANNEELTRLLGEDPRLTPQMLEAIAKVANKKMPVDA